MRNCNQDILHGRVFSLEEGEIENEQPMARG